QAPDVLPPVARPSMHPERFGRRIEKRLLGVAMRADSGERVGEHGPVACREAPYLDFLVRRSAIDILSRAKSLRGVLHRGEESGIVGRAAVTVDAVQEQIRHPVASP